MATLQEVILKNMEVLDSARKGICHTAKKVTAKYENTTSHAADS